MLEGIRDWAEENSFSVDDCIKSVITVKDIKYYIKDLIKDVEKWEEDKCLK